MDDDKKILLFRSIVKFVNSLNECFGKSHKSLQLYSRLIKKTTIMHEQAIDKHINLFREFCKTNNEQILNKQKKFNTYTIKYSERVFINFEPIFKKANDENLATIWKYLLTILAFVSPSSRAKDLLKKSIKKNPTPMSNNSDGTKESDFINKIIHTVENTVDDDMNDPMQAVNKMMTSGSFQGLMSSMNNGLTSGELDVGKLLGTVQGMVSTLGNDLSGNSNVNDNDINQMNQMMGQMNGMVNMMTQMTGISGSSQNQSNSESIFSQNTTDQANVEEIE